jgi:hypothetical protein
MVRILLSAGGCGREEPLLARLCHHLQAIDPPVRYQPYRDKVVSGMTDGSGLTIDGDAGTVTLADAGLGGHQYHAHR